MAARASVTAQEVAPIIIDLGKKKRRQIKNLKNGTGRLIAEVSEVLDEVRNNLGADMAGKQLVPVVLIYKRKSRRRRNSGLTLPLPFLG